jgi:uncharacterized protein YfbU (UPF0304 family)
MLEEEDCPHNGEVERVKDMDIPAFEAKLKELLNEISDIPNSQGKKLLLLTQKAKPISQKLNNTETIEESLEHLRLILKYLLFDVEATRRENSYLRKMLENQEG